MEDLEDLELPVNLKETQNSLLASNLTLAWVPCGQTSLALRSGSAWLIATESPSLLQNSVYSEL